MKTALSAACSRTAAAKSALRRKILAVRRKMTSVARAEASAQICANLMKTPELAGAKCIAAFAPTEEEVDIRPLLDECRRCGKQIALPRVCGQRRLAFYFVSQADAPRLRRGYKNILQPDENFPAAPVQMFDFAIIPAVAADSRFFRLGYGGGFYDTLMSDERFAAISCAAVFWCQRVAEVPTESHDRRVDMIFSEERNG